MKLPINMSKICNALLLLCASLFYSITTQALDIVRSSAMLDGPTGFVITPSAMTVGEGRANVGLWGNVETAGFDNLYFIYGVRNWLELGVAMDGVRQNELDVLFKVNSGSQDKLFKGFPLLALGVYHSRSYLSATYQVNPLTLSFGKDLELYGNSLFFGVGVKLQRRVLLQMDVDGDDYGLGLRGQLNRIQFSFMLHSSPGQLVSPGRLYVGAGFSI